MNAANEYRRGPLWLHAERPADRLSYRLMKAYQEAAKQGIVKAPDDWPDFDIVMRRTILIAAGWLEEQSEYASALGDLATSASFSLAGQALRGESVRSY